MLDSATCSRRDCTDEYDNVGVPPVCGADRSPADAADATRPEGGGPAEWIERFRQLADLGTDLVVVGLPGTDVSAVDPVTEAAEAVASYGRPTPPALEPVSLRQSA